MENTEKKKLPSATKNSLACGYMGLFFWIIPAFVGIVGVMFGIKGYKLKKKKLAYLSISLCSLAVILSFLNGAFGFFKWDPKLFFTTGTKEKSKEEQLTKYTDSIHKFEILYPSYLKRKLHPKTVFYVVNPEIENGVFIEKLSIKIIENIKNYEKSYNERITHAKKNTYKIKNFNIEELGSFINNEEIKCNWLLTTYINNDMKVRTLQAEFLKNETVYQITISGNLKRFLKNKDLYFKILKYFKIQ